MENSLPVTALVGRRVLISGERRFSNETVTEMKILEVSPSGQWVKMMSMVGTRFWRPTTNVSLIEVLLDLKVSEPKPA